MVTGAPPMTTVRAAVCGGNTATVASEVTVTALATRANTRFAKPS